MSEDRVILLEAKLKKLEAVFAEALAKNEALRALEKERDMELQKISYERKFEEVRRDIAQEIARRIEAEKTQAVVKKRCEVLEQAVTLLLNEDREPFKRWCQQEIKKRQQRVATMDRNIEFKSSELRVYGGSSTTLDTSRAHKILVLEAEIRLLEEEAVVEKDAVQWFEECLSKA